MSITKKIKERASDELLIRAQMLIDHGFINSITIRGEPGVGKSVVALEIMRRANILLKKYFKKKVDDLI